MLIARPESIIDAGFQMSLAAVAALGGAWRNGTSGGSAVRGAIRSARYLVGIVVRPAWWRVWRRRLSSCFTSAAPPITRCWAICSVMPVMGLWIMPLAALSVMLMPFGLEGWVLPALGWGIDLMVRMGAWVSSLPGAVSLTSAMPLAALVLIALGGLWAMIWQKNWRWWGAAPIVLGVLLAFLTPRPDMLVAPDAQTIAIRGDDGLLHFLRKPKRQLCRPRVAAARRRRRGDR